MAKVWSYYGFLIWLQSEGWVSLGSCVISVNASSSPWAAAQQRHLGAFNPKENGQKWAADMATVILQGWLNLWESRNEDKHGRDRETRAQTRREQAHRKLDWRQGRI